MSIKSKILVMTTLISSIAGTSYSQTDNGKEIISRQTPEITNRRLDPMSLWAMGRIGSFDTDKKSGKIVYNVSYYSVKQNKSHTVVYIMNADGTDNKMLTNSEKSESAPKFICGGERIAFLAADENGTSQIWTMKTDGTERTKLTASGSDIEDYSFSPDEKKVLVVRQVNAEKKDQTLYKDLDKATGMVIDDLMYKHWDEWVKTIPHCFVAKFENNKIDNYIDIIGDNEPFECPMKPFGGIEQTAWSPDSKTIAYTCRKKTGLKYSISTDSDIFLYNTEDKTTVNICKPNGYEEPEIDPTLSMKNQKVNKQTADLNLGYDTNPAFSPDGKYLAWQSMKNNGYESDRNRICLYNIATGEKAYITDSFDSNAESFCWSSDGKSVFFTGVWHGTIQVYNATLTGKIKQITSGQYDYNTIMTSGSNIVCTRQSMKQPTEIYLLNTKKGTTKALTSENKWFYDNIDWGEVEPRWTKTTDGKDMLTWVVFPPNFDKTKKYPALLFCEGGPQSPVSQFWSYRWNMQIMAANGYIVVAPNRRGLPGFGSEWNEEISTNYGGQCMNDYLSAIDDISKEPYVDADRMGCVGASFGGFSVYYLAGNHNKRFKCFIAHDGIYNLEQQYLETEELWFTNWDLGGAPWHKDIPEVKRSYAASPHLFVDKWDTPILCIHGEKDYRIVASQAMSAFNAAKLRGVPAELLIYPDENHWVLKPQNGVLWQRTFFNWLDKWLKN